MEELSATCATRAYFDALHLEPGSFEFVSALATGVKAKLIVEVTSQASPLTIALAAAAARQTGGRLVCILQEPLLEESKVAISKSGLKEQVEFKTEEPSEVLAKYENIDFSLVDCEGEGYTRLLNLLDVNPTRSVVGGRRGLEGCVRGKNNENSNNNVAVRSLNHLIGKGMEVTMIGIKHNHRNGFKKRNNKSLWVAKIDEESGEEHIFRVPQVDWY